MRSLLSDLIERGLDADRARLWVIDGGKALRKAIVETFGAAALIQRCQEHKTDMKRLLAAMDARIASQQPADLKAA